MSLHQLFFKIGKKIQKILIDIVVLLYFFLIIFLPTTTTFSAESRKKSTEMPSTQSEITSAESETAPPEPEATSAESEIPSVEAQSAPVSVESKVDKTEVTIGDPIQYSLKVIYQKELKISLPELGSNLGQFDILDYQISEVNKKEANKEEGNKEGEKLFQTITYTIAAYDTGTYQIPSAQVTYLTAEGEQKTVSAKKLEISVKAVAPEDAQDIKDIKGPQTLERNWKPYRKILFRVLLIVLLTCLLIWGIWYYRKKKAIPAQEQKIIRPAHEVAYEELKKIWEAFSGDKQMKIFYLRLSEIMRQYLSSLYKINALEATTEEIVAEIKRKKLHWNQQTLLSNFLSDCDMVKFAKYVPPLEEVETIHQTAFRIVDETKKEEKIKQDKIITTTTNKAWV